MKYIKVKYLSTRDEEYAKAYTYADKLKCKKFDSVLVPTQYGLTLAIVTEINAEPLLSHCDIKSTVEIVKINAVDDYIRVAKRKDLEKRMEQKTENLDKLARFKMYAAQDPDFAQLVEEYEALV